MIIEIIGYTVAILSALTMLPQIARSIRTKSVEDISFAMLFMYTINTILWIIYGILIGAKPVILADGFACVAGITQLIIKFKYNKTNKIQTQLIKNT